ncbi:hypothetical protein [Flavitalea sp.]|nr:hypothetical protein [Flavitalea sp.]
MMTERLSVLLIITLILYIFCLLAVDVNGQSASSSESFTERGPGAFSKKFTDIFCLANNPAASTGSESFSAGIYSERRFMLKELSQYYLVLAHSTTHANIGVKLHYSGFSDYNESSASLSYGRDLGKLRVGMRFNYHKISISGYGSTSTWSADISVIWQLTEKLRAGIQAINPIPVPFGPDKSEHFASLYKLGMGYEIADKCFLGGELYKETGKTVNVQLLLQYRLDSRLSFRGGLNTNVGQPFAGVEWFLNDFRLGIDGSYHPDLGFTPALMISFKKQKSN